MALPYVSPTQENRMSPLTLHLVAASTQSYTKPGTSAEVGEIIKDWESQEFPKGGRNDGLYIDRWALYRWKGGEDISGEGTWAGNERNVYNISRRHQEKQLSWERRQGWSEHRAHKLNF